MAENDKKEQLSPEREKLEIQLKEVEINVKRQELEYSKMADDLDIERKQLENEEIRTKGTGYNSPIQQLLDVASAFCIDNDRSTIGSEPAYKSIWDEKELEEIKSLIMKKAKKL